MKHDTILFIGAHHDDSELVGGSIARYRRAGWRVISIVITNGTYVDGKVAEEHIAIRERESLAAAELVGLECVFLRFPEGDLEVTSAVRQAVLQEIRRFSPKLVVTHPPDDYHTDHIATSDCVTLATRQTSNPCVRTAAPPCPPPKLYYRDAWFVPFVPDEYVDISDTLDLKLQMLACHKSQKIDSGAHGPGLLELAQLQSRIRGVEAGVRHAEAFRLCYSPGSVRLRTLLGT